MEKTEDKGVTQWVENAAIEDLGDDLGKKETVDLAAGLLASGHIQITHDELLALDGKLDQMPIDKAKTMLKDLFPIYEHDPRMDPQTLTRMKMFIDDSSITDNPQLYESLIYEMRIFALLGTVSSAYSEVRAVASDTDDPTTPSLTIRVMVIGTLLSAMGCIINAVFAMRYPSIHVSPGMIQLLAYPWGVGWAKLMPNWHIFGIPLNPGAFSKKEHLLIYCMSVLGVSFPPTQHLIFVQAMPQFFNMEYARKPGYQFLGALGTNLIGFGFAGLTRRFLIYPAYCVWPGSLGTIAVNNALHEKSGDKTPVKGPFGTSWVASMWKCFWVLFGVEFCFYFFPSFIWTSLTIFDWISWIKPTNGKLVALTSGNWGVGLGFNPLATFDYSYLISPGGYFPQFIHNNFIAGVTVAMIASAIVWFRNGFDTGYLPINNSSTFDNRGESFSVLKIVDKNGVLDESKYQQYSAPYMSAANVVSTCGNFMFSSATLMHTMLYNYREVIIGLHSFYDDLRNWVRRLRGKEAPPRHSIKNPDVHKQIMDTYPEVPEWWFICVLASALLFSMLCLGIYTPVTLTVVLAAPILTLIFIVPFGIVTAMAGQQPTLNTIALMFGGLIYGGNTMAVQYFRMFGSEPVYHALIYANDLKLGQYAHVPPRHMFYCQMWGAVIGTLLTVCQWSWLMDLKDICTPKAPFRLICPDVLGNYTMFIMNGTIGPKRLYGPGSRYQLLLLGFPLGILIPIAFFFIKKRFPRSRFLQSTHPLLFCLACGYFGGNHWGAYLPGVFINYFSWNYLKVHYLEFWSRYNYVALGGISSAFPINAILTFLAFAIPGVKFPNWWGTTGGTPGCIGDWNNAACAPYKIDPAIGYFGPPPGQIPQ